MRNREREREREIDLEKVTLLKCPYLIYIHVNYSYSSRWKSSTRRVNRWDWYIMEWHIDLLSLEERKSKKRKKLEYISRPYVQEQLWRGGGCRMYWVSYHIAMHFLLQVLSYKHWINRHMQTHYWNVFICL